jgi:hypothetical protein
MKPNNTTRTNPKYTPVCFHCGRARKDMKPVNSRWGTWHVCRVCDVRAALQVAELRAKTERARGEL